MCFLTNLFNSFGTFVLSVLPTSPFHSFLSTFAIPYLSYINWFIPVDRFVEIGTAWLISIGLYYCYLVIGRWIKIFS